MKLCIFCENEVDEDAISCPGCKEYKGIVGVHPHFSEADQEWQLINDETHEVIRTGNSPEELR